MGRCYIYVVDRDFGFAPNPFHGSCTLATCKPGIRSRARIGDWIIGVGGRRLRSTGRCIFAMRVSDAVGFDEYWSDPRYLDKRPVRNGSQRMMVGDNIYHRPTEAGPWEQEDSHHSNADGSPNEHNILHDTKADRVLISDHYFYFGRSAPEIPTRILEELGYTNGRNYRVYSEDEAVDLTRWLHAAYGENINTVLDDPFDFDESNRRYSAHDNRVR